MASQSAIIDPHRLRSLLRQMIDIYSPSGKEEDLLDFLYDYLEGEGLKPRRQAVDDTRYNLLVMPNGLEPDAVLLGHVDTVSAYELDAFSCQEEGDRIRGLGAADMKGGCAAMIEAFLSVCEKTKEPVPAALALVVGEEEEGDGAEKLIEEHHFSWALIGEPTDLHPCLSHSGYLEIQLRTQGLRRHASLANRRENAVEIMLHAILKLTRHLERERPDAVFNIRDLFSARAGFVVPDRCEAWLDLHLPPLAPISEIASELETAFCVYCDGQSRASGDFRINTIDSGYALPEQGPVGRALQAVYRRLGREWQPRVFQSHSDANQLWAAGIKPVLLGPGRLEMAHIPEESVSFDKVCDAARLYSEILKTAVRQ